MLSQNRQRPEEIDKMPQVQVSAFNELGSMVPYGIMGRSIVSLGVWYPDMSCICIKLPSSMEGLGIPRLRFCFEYMSLNIMPSSGNVESCAILNMSADALRWMLANGGE